MPVWTQGPAGDKVRASLEEKVACLRAAVRLCTCECAFNVRVLRLQHPVCMRRARVRLRGCGSLRLQRACEDGQCALRMQRAGEDRSCAPACACEGCTCTRACEARTCGLKRPHVDLAHVDLSVHMHTRSVHMHTRAHARAHTHTCTHTTPTHPPTHPHAHTGARPYRLRPAAGPGPSCRPTRPSLPSTGDMYVYVCMHLCTDVSLSSPNEASAALVDQHRCV